MPHKRTAWAADAAAILKALAHETRFLVLCHLATGEKSVSELEVLIGIRQPTLSQQLARLRRHAVVKTRREAKTVYYSVAREEAAQVVQLLAGRHLDWAKTPGDNG